MTVTVTVTVTVTMDAPGYTCLSICIHSIHSLRIASNYQDLGSSRQPRALAGLVLLDLALFCRIFAGPRRLECGRGSAGLRGRHVDVWKHAFAAVDNSGSLQGLLGKLLPQLDLLPARPGCVSLEIGLSGTCGLAHTDVLRVAAEWGTCAHMRARKALVVMCMVHQPSSCAKEREGERERGVLTAGHGYGRCKPSQMHTSTQTEKEGLPRNEEYMARFSVAMPTENSDAYIGMHTHAHMCTQV